MSDPTDIIEEFLQAVIHEDRLKIILLIRTMKEQKILNIGSINGHTPISFAVCKEDYDTIDLLLEAGADINAKPDIGLRPIWWAMYDNLQQMVPYLVQRGADIDRLDNVNKTVSVLMWAAQYSDSAMVKLLLDCGANPNLTDDTGNTALQLAEKESNSDTAEILRQVMVEKDLPPYER